MHGEPPSFLLRGGLRNLGRRSMHIANGCRSDMDVQAPLRLSSPRCSKLTGIGGAYQASLNTQSIEWVSRVTRG
jgi:hypothetical protein